jgi:predicted TPR repeat methyltransferase
LSLYALRDPTVALRWVPAEGAFPFSLSGFDTIAEIYDATRSLPEEEMQMVLDALTRFLDPRWIILDAGVGTGRFAAPLRESGFEMLGIGVSAKMMSKARQKRMTDLIRGSIPSSLSATRPSMRLS